jgi:hypothetical protein
MKLNKRLIGLIFSFILLSACESVTDINGKITFESDNFSGTKEIGEFEITALNQKVTFPYKLKELEGADHVRLQVFCELRNTDLSETAVEVFSKDIEKGEGALSFTAQDRGEYEVYLQSNSSVEIEIKLNLKSVDGSLDLD